MNKTDIKNNNTVIVHVDQTKGEIIGTKLIYTIKIKNHSIALSNVVTKLPILMYSSSVWDPYSIPNINKLEKVQHFALKLAVKIGPLTILYFNNSSILLLYPPVEQHPSLSFYTSSSLVSSTFQLALFI